MALKSESNDQSAEPGAKQTADGDKGPQDGKTSGRRRFRIKSIAGFSLLGFVAVLIVCTVFYIWYSGRYESTDDAQIDGHIDPISARVSGYVKAVYVEDGQSVKAGAVLVQIDPTDYQSAYDLAKAAYEQAVADNQGAQINVQVVSTNSINSIAEARADLEVARSTIATSQQAYKEAQAGQSETEAQDALARQDLKRATQLLTQNIISRASYDKYKTTAKSAAAALQASRAKVESAARQVAQARAQLEKAQANLRDAQSGPEEVQIAKSKAHSTSAAVQKARAAMEQAQLKLQYTRIVAPVAGVVGDKTAEVGQNVSPDQMLMSLVQVRDVWVTANFKENQLHHMRPGQPVTIHVDAFDKDYQGHVDSIGGATGERFSLFPPENATGNYVKVVQRIPVRIVFDKGQNRRHRLRPGMSVEPKVWIK
jgi:membrane fusion protein (multidrug efflux system)